jgi:hypothetical protein
MITVHEVCYTGLDLLVSITRESIDCCLSVSDIYLSVIQRMAAVAVAAVVAAEAFLADFPDLDQMLTMCGFTNAVDRARLIDYERFESLEAFGDYTDMMIESMADKNEKRTPAGSRVRLGIQHVLYVKAAGVVLGAQTASQRHPGVD